MEELRRLEGIANNVRLEAPGVLFVPSRVGFDRPTRVGVRDLARLRGVSLNSGAALSLP